MFKYNYYIPILKGKQGEFRALRDLSEKTKQKFIPLICVPPPKKSLEKHLNNIADKITTLWGYKRPFFLDLFALKLTERTSSGTHPLNYIFQRMKKSRLFAPFAIPTTGLDRDDAYNSAVVDIISKDKRGVCIRLLEQYMIDAVELNDKLNELLEKLKISKKEANLLFDFRAICMEDVRDTADTAIKIINELPNISEWQTLTIAASGFPETLSEIRRDSIIKLPRAELALWQLIIAQSKRLPRIPSYGDYGIVHPNHLVLDPRRINPSAKIRYTLDEEWLVLKGQSLRKHSKKYKQYHGLSQGLVDRDEFMGASFSKGDEYIAKCADGNVSSGNLETWIRVDTIHHLTLVSDQIANTVAI